MQQEEEEWLSGEEPSGPKNGAAVPDLMELDGQISVASNTPLPPQTRQEEEDLIDYDDDDRAEPPRKSHAQNNDEVIVTAQSLLQEATATVNTRATGQSDAKKKKNLARVAQIPLAQILCSQCDQQGHNPADCTRNLENGFIGTRICIFCNTKEHSTAECPLLASGKITSAKAFHYVVRKRDGRPPVYVPWWPWQIDFQKWMSADENGYCKRPQTPGFAQRQFEDKGVWQDLTEIISDGFWSKATPDWTAFDFCRECGADFDTPNEWRYQPLPPQPQPPARRSEQLEGPRRLASPQREELKTEKGAKKQSKQGSKKESDTGRGEASQDVWAPRLKQASEDVWKPRLKPAPEDVWAPRLKQASQDARSSNKRMGEDRSRKRHKMPQGDDSSDDSLPPMLEKAFEKYLDRRLGFSNQQGQNRGRLEPMQSQSSYPQISPRSSSRPPNPARSRPRGNGQPSGPGSQSSSRPPRGRDRRSRSPPPPPPRRPLVDYADLNPHLARDTDNSRPPRPKPKEEEKKDEDKDEEIGDGS